MLERNEKGFFNLQSAYNLLADCVDMAERHKERQKTLTEEQDAILRKEIDTFLNQYNKVFKNISIEAMPQSVVDEISKYAGKLDIYRLRHLVGELDRRIWTNSGYSELSNETFSSLNSNVEKTGIVLLPKVEGLKTEHTFENGDTRKRKTAEEWALDYNGSLNHFYYVRAVNLEGYELRNIYYDAFATDTLPEELVVAAAPLCGGEEHAIGWEESEETSEEGLEVRYLDRFYVKDPEKIGKAMERACDLAVDHGAHLLVGPEMLGTEDLYSLEKDRYNSFFYRWNMKQSPNMSRASSLKLICAPSNWANNSNVVHIYRPDGKILGKQFKQTPFRTKTPAAEEKLIKPPREIFILHIPYIGRVMFPVCVDFLNPGYRELLVRELKASLLICPSYTSGLAEFENAIGSLAEYGCSLVWINCCTAWSGAGYAGAVSAPAVPVTHGRQRFELQCDKKCEAGCIFLAKIPMNLAGELPRLDRSVSAAQKR